MNIAFLFNSDHPSLGGYYGPSVMRRILSTGVLQKADRHMRVSVGDILTYGSTRTLSSLIKLCNTVYQPIDFDRLIRDRLDATHGKATVYCWLFQNMTAEIAEALHLALAPDPAYLGAMDVDFSNPFHLRFFRNSLIEAYRVRNTHCSMFYEMGENEEPDIVPIEIFEQGGFTVQHEDMGARRTIFDNYDTLEHFGRIEEFKRVFAGIEGLDRDRASDLALTLEELHPKLFDALASAARALERAETVEDVAQSALSGRRLLEQVADYLFPPRPTLWNDRKVGRPQYRNRLWAYLEQTCAELGLDKASALTTLGKEADRLVELFNAGLHADPTREKVETAFRDLVLWLTSVIEISPAHARRPYLAYEQELGNFMRDVLGDRIEPDENSG
jgi:hypothetical protein